MLRLDYESGSDTNKNENCSSAALWKVYVDVEQPVSCPIYQGILHWRVDSN